MLLVLSEVVRILHTSHFKAVVDLSVAASTLRCPDFVQPGLRPPGLGMYRYTAQCAEW